jgi:two-component system alkaline phosphatase synthesis response regulator PhoP
MDHSLGYGFNTSKGRFYCMMTGQKHILLVEDEPHLAFNMELNLQAEGYRVTLAKDGREAIEKYSKDGPFALVILDVMLPEMNGFEVASHIRQNDKITGILMLTARASENDVLQGLETGADDYMTKPFSLQELFLRVKRMADRSDLFSPLRTGKQTALIQFHDVIWNPQTFELKGPQGSFVLTALEAKVLTEFLEHPQEILTRKHLLGRVWGVHGNVETRTVDNFIMRLRKYFEKDPSQPEILQSVRGRGYKFCAELKEVSG